MQLKPVDSSENLSRFILHHKYWYKTDNPPVQSRVKHAAFLPGSDKETSVFRTSEISDENIWDIGEREVSVKRGKPILGRADVIAFVVLSTGLKIIPSEPPERHANITEWPEERSKQKLIALEIASKASLYLK